MKLFCAIVAMFISTIIIYKYLIDKRKRDFYLKAGDKWDRIVKELSRRK